MRPALPMLATTLLVATALLGQPASGQRPHPDHALEEGQILSQCFQPRVAAIQQTLGFPEDRARALAERWLHWDREGLERMRQLGQLRHQCTQVLLGAGSEEQKNAAIKPLLEAFLLLRRQREEAKGRFETEILANLSPAQKVRLIILVEDQQGKLRGLLHEHRDNPAMPGSMR